MDLLAAVETAAEAAAEAAYDNAYADTVVDTIDAGSGAGYVELRTGASPGTGSAATGTLFATITLSDPAFGAASSGVASISGTPSDTAVADVASVDAGAYYRVYDSDDTVVADGTVAFTDAGEDMIVGSDAVTTGDTVTILTWTVTVSGSTA